jgi:hypothetical protein
MRCFRVTLNNRKHSIVLLLDLARTCYPIVKFSACMLYCCQLIRLSLYEHGLELLFQLWRSLCWLRDHLVRLLVDKLRYLRRDHRRDRGAIKGGDAQKHRAAVHYADVV